jgi:hypothetical protein
LVGVAGGNGVEVFVGIRVGVGEFVGVSSGVEVKVIVSVGVAVGVTVGGYVGVTVAVSVNVAVGVNVSVGVLVAVAVGVSVGKPACPIPNDAITSNLVELARVQIANAWPRQLPTRSASIERGCPWLLICSGFDHVLKGAIDSWRQTLPESINQFINFDVAGAKLIAREFTLPV